MLLKSGENTLIEKITGILDQKTDFHSIITVGGVGFKIKTSHNCMKTLPTPGQRTSLLTYLHVKEDILDLYGFSDEGERKIFLLLISISGIGPKLALTILSGLEYLKLKEKIIDGDVGALTDIQGVGLKTAKRIIIELKDKLSKSIDDALGFDIEKNHSQLHSDVINALISLGYKSNFAKNACSKLQKKGEFEGKLEDIIKKALKEIGT